MVKIESYGDILLYFNECGIMKEIFDFRFTAMSTSYNS